MKKLWHKFCCYIGIHDFKKLSVGKNVTANGRVIARVVFADALVCVRCDLCNAENAHIEIETDVKGEC